MSDETKKLFEHLCTVECELNIALNRIQKIKRYVLSEDEEVSDIQPDS